MTPIELSLTKIGEEQTKKIRGIAVIREVDNYIIKDNDYSLGEAAKYIQEHGSSRYKFPYDEIAFLLKKPFHSIVISKHRIKNRAQHVELLKKAKKKKCYIYFANVENKDGKWMAVEPHTIDWESVDNIHGSIDGIGKDNIISDSVIDNVNGLVCPYCDKAMSSTPGRTLHVKSKHADKYEEYLSKK
jgi:hypothetical protein